MHAAILELDEQSIRPEELSMPALMRELNLQNRPSWALSLLMNALEKKRQAKGLGWSRAWNKYGMTVFRTHVHDVVADVEIFDLVLPLLDRHLKRASGFYRNFVAELLADPNRMAFTFYHNHTTEAGRQFEGLTISIGRKVVDDKTKRDRIDIILEDEREAGAVDGLVDRVRIYVCPWATYGQDRSFLLSEVEHPKGGDIQLVQNLFSQCVQKYHAWKDDEARQWSHWSARYIDYFGPRSFIPQGSSFI